MKISECVDAEWGFKEWNGINRRNGEERRSKMTKNGYKI